MKRAPDDLLPEEEALLGRLSGAHRACPDPSLIQAAAAEALPDASARDVREHLESCAACAALAADLEAWEGPGLSAHEEERIWRRVRRSAGAPPSVARATPRRWVWAAAAAVFAAAVPAYFLVSSGIPPSPSPSGAGTPPPSFTLALDKLGPRTPPGAALVWRNGEPSLERDLEQALAPYEAGDFAEADRRLGALAARYPRAAAVPLYRGVSLLLLGRPADAVPALAAARERATPFWMPHAQWYLAVARERTGDASGASSLLRELCGGGSEYDARACAGAGALGGARP